MEMQQTNEQTTIFFLYPYPAYNAMHSPNYILQVDWDDIVHYFKVTGGSTYMSDWCLRHFNTSMFAQIRQHLIRNSGLLSD